MSHRPLLQPAERLLRLPPHLPLIWLTPDTVQVGVDPPRATLTQVPDGAPALLHALGSGVSSSGLDMLAQHHRVPGRWLTDALRVLEPLLQSDPPATPKAISLWSSIADTAGFARHAEQAGYVVSVPDDVQKDTDWSRPVLVIADYLIHPGWLVALAMQQRAHLPVLFSDQSIRVGPLIRFGESPCLVCAESMQRDEQPHWLEVASQLWSRTSPLHSRHHCALAWAAAHLYLDRVRIVGLRHHLDQLVFRPGEGTLGVEQPPFHPRCTCRGLLPLEDEGT